MRAIRSKRPLGFTMIELLIGLFVGAILLMLAGGVYLTVLRSFQTGSKKLLAQREASLLSTVISRRVRVGSSFQIYVVPVQQVPADSGDGLAILDGQGGLMGRLEWDAVQGTLVDSAGARVTSMTLHDVQFTVDPAKPRTVLYRYKTDDEKGNLVDIESAVTLRN